MDIAALLKKASVHRDHGAHHQCDIRDARRRCTIRAQWAGVYRGRRVLLCDAHKAVLGSTVDNVHRVTS